MFDEEEGQILLNRNEHYWGVHTFQISGSSSLLGIVRPKQSRLQ